MEKGTLYSKERIGLERGAAPAKLVFVAALVGCLSARALELHFLQNGETTWERSKVLQGSIPYVGLTPRGEWMAEETARGMAAAGIRYDRIFASDLLRACRTAEIVANEQGVKPVADARLREMGLGRYEGVRYGEGEYPDGNIKNLLEGAGPYVPTGDGAESLDDVAARVKSFLDEKVRPLEGKVDKVLCVTHPLAIRALVREFAGDEAAKSAVLRSCSIHVLECKDGRFATKGTGRTFYDLKNFEVMPEPLTVAHRGFGNKSSWRPESTRSAYSNAVVSACDIVKLDLRCTKDGIPVMHHDGSLRRLMNWDVAITNVTYAEIMEKGRYCLRRDNKDKTKLTPTTMKIVRLDEALAVARAVPQFWLDFKYFSPEFAEKAVQMLRDEKIDFSRVMLATFNEEALAYFQRNYPSIRRISHIFWRYFPEPNNVYGFLVAGMYRDADAPFRRGKPIGHFKTREKMMAAVVDYVRKLGLYGVSLPIYQATAEDVKLLHENGAKWVSLYFVQETEQAAKVRSWGLNGFVTDHVKDVRKAYYKNSVEKCEKNK